MQFTAKSFSLVLLTLVCVAFSASAQNPVIDSLNNLLKDVKEDTLKVNVLYNLSFEYRNTDLDKHKDYAAKGYELALKLDYKKGIADNLYLFGNINRLEGNYEKSLSFLSRSLELSEQINYKRGIANSLNNLGNVYKLQGNYTTAIEHFKRSIVIREESKEYIKVGDCYNNLGNVYLSMGDYDQAIFTYQKARDFYEKNNGSRDQIISVLLNIGSVYYDLKEYSKSLNFYEQCLANNASSFSLGNVYNNIGNIFMIQKDYDKAEEYFLKALTAYKDADSKEGICVVQMNRAGNYQEAGKLEEATKYNGQALTLAEELGDKNRICNITLSIAQNYLAKKDFTKALEYAEKAISLAKEIGAKTILLESYNTLSRVYKESHNYEKSLEFYKLSTELKDSMFSQEKIKSIAELETKYEADKKEKEIELLKKDNELKEKSFKEQKIIRSSLIGGLILLLVLSFTLYNRYRLKQKSNLLLEKQKEEIQKQNIQITDSIDYAKTIQEAILPSDNLVKQLFPDSFILYKPKAIVSGDFYWVGEKDNKMICAVADCTGHGVPGAFMSLLGNNVLENVIKKNELINPALILDALNKEIVTIMKQGTEKLSVKNGMDIALIIIDKTKRQLEYAGAHNSLYIVRAGKLSELKADKMAIGSLSETPKAFTNHTMELQKGDILYMFSDGFPDQIGGSERKKFFYQPFKDLLLSIHELELPDQKKKLDEAITNWKGEREQTDDILVIGIKC